MPIFEIKSGEKITSKYFMAYMAVKPAKTESQGTEKIPFKKDFLLPS